MANLSGGVITPPAASGSQARTTAVYTTASLVDGAVETGAITMTKGYRVLRIQTSRAARVELYTTAANRTADASRAIGTDPAAGAGVVMDYLTTGAITADLSPLVDGANMETVPAATIPIAVTNKSGATGTVTVTLTYIATEV